MDTLSSDLLPLIFIRLDSKTMIKVRRVCKQWLEIIDENKNNFRSLVFTDLVQWSPSILDEFDLKSASSIKEVDIRVIRLSEGEVEHLIKTLRKSQKTLRLLSLNVIFSHNLRPISFKSLPNLTELRVLHPSTFFPRVKLVKAVKGKEDESKGARGLQVLLSHELRVEDRDVLKNLVSLSVETGMKSKVWRKILIIPSRRLRHLKLSILQTSSSEVIEPLHFPRLQVLEVHIPKTKRFPAWMKVPALRTLKLLHSYLPSGLPSTCELWIVGMKGVENLHRSCPVLETLVLDIRAFPSTKSVESLLRARRKKASDGLKVNGIRMADIRTLVISFDKRREDAISTLPSFEKLGSEEISSLNSVVEEVVDLSKFERITDVFLDGNILI